MSWVKQFVTSRHRNEALRRGELDSGIGDHVRSVHVPPAPLVYTHPGAPPPVVHVWVPGRSALLDVMGQSTQPTPEERVDVVP